MDCDPRFTFDEQGETMKVRVLELAEGAAAARGTTVIIDVFRAFTLECYLFARGAKKIYPIGSAGFALACRQKDPQLVAFGERGGAKIEGFDFGNSPSELGEVNLDGKSCIHTTSAGTQGIVRAQHASEVVCASLVNAKATARYVAAQNPREVSLVAMGNAATSSAEEDLLCAEYIKALLEGREFDVRPQAEALATTAGAKFFDPARPEFPEADFPLCVDCDRFDFAICVRKESDGRLVNLKTPV